MDSKFVVITSSGGHHHISEATNQMLMQAGLDDLVQLDDGTKLKVSASMEIMPLDVYYEQYPAKKPAPIFEDGFKKYENPKALAEHLVATSPTSGVEQMLKGLARFIAEERAKGKTPANAIAMYEDMEKKLKRRQSANT